MKGTVTSHSPIHSSFQFFLFTLCNSEQQRLELFPSDKGAENISVYMNHQINLTCMCHSGQFLHSDEKKQMKAWLMFLIYSVKKTDKIYKPVTNDNHKVNFQKSLWNRMRRLLFSLLCVAVIVNNLVHLLKAIILKEIIKDTISKTVQLNLWHNVFLKPYSWFPDYNPF